MFITKKQTKITFIHVHRHNLKFKQKKNYLTIFSHYFQENFLSKIFIQIFRIFFYQNIRNFIKYKFLEQIYEKYN